MELKNMSQAGLQQITYKSDKHLQCKAYQLLIQTFMIHAYLSAFYGGLYM